MNGWWVKYPQNFIAHGGMAVAIFFFTTLLPSHAAEPSRLPAAQEPPASASEVLELTQKVRELEAIVQSLQQAPSITPPASYPNTPAGHQATGRPPHVTWARLTRALDTPRRALDIGGYVKADFIHDFDAIGTTDVFDPLSIPTDGRPGENTRLHARQTRLNLDFRPHPNRQDMHLFIETDFFGTSDPFRRSRAFLRLRHAYLGVGKALLGQTWSTFMDETILPTTLDFESPRSVLLDRRALFRWTEKPTDALAVAVAIEDPRPIFDLNAAPAGDLERPTPDLIGRVRYERPWGHLQSAALVRMLRYRQDSGAEDDEVGWGFNFTGRVRPHDFDSVLFQVAFGEAIESYRQAPDAAVDANGKIEVLPLVAWVLGYEVHWTKRLTSTFVYSEGDSTNAAFQAPTAPQAVEYVAANLVCHPRPRLSYGVEYLYGTRTDKDDSMGKANRIQFSVRMDLP